MKWTAERDLLIAQTMAFVQSVTGRKPDVDGRVEFTRSSPVVTASAVEPEKLESSVEATAAAPEPVVAPSPVRAEIEGRVAAFRAHQQRFDRERDRHFTSVLTGIRAAITDSSRASPP
jgi:hypothetical protein